MDRKLTTIVKPNVSIQKSAEDACKGAEAIVVCTEWDEFKTLDWEKSESLFHIHREGGDEVMGMEGRTGSSRNKRSMALAGHTIQDTAS